jgi:hypothetical protein
MSFVESIWADANRPDEASIAAISRRLFASGSLLRWHFEIDGETFAFIITLHWLSVLTSSSKSMFVANREVLGKLPEEVEIHNLSGLIQALASEHTNTSSRQIKYTRINCVSQTQPDEVDHGHADLLGAQLAEKPVL